MIRAVFDTNAIVPAALVEEGHLAAILDLAVNRKILMFTSPALLAEYEEVLRRPRLKLSPSRVRAFIAVIRRTSRHVNPTLTLTLSAHESDNRICECATAGAVDYIVTGNAKHFQQEYRSIRIVTLREFIELARAELSLPG
jgi:putative PIN family toxin of toxin-antitoxin system